MKAYIVVSFDDNEVVEIDALNPREAVNKALIDLGWDSDTDFYDGYSLFVWEYDKASRFDLEVKRDFILVAKAVKS